MLWWKLLNAIVAGLNGVNSHDGPDAGYSSKIFIKGSAVSDYGLGLVGSVSPETSSMASKKVAHCFFDIRLRSAIAINCRCFFVQRNSARQEILIDEDCTVLIKIPTIYHAPCKQWKKKASSKLEVDRNLGKCHRGTGTFSPIPGFI